MPFENKVNSFYRSFYVLLAIDCNEATLENLQTIVWTFKTNISFSFKLDLYFCVTYSLNCKQQFCIIVTYFYCLFSCLQNVFSFKGTSNSPCQLVRHYRGHRDGVWEVSVSNGDNPLLGTASAGRYTICYWSKLVDLVSTFGKTSICTVNRRYLILNRNANAVLYPPNFHQFSPFSACLYQCTVFTPMNASPPLINAPSDFSQRNHQNTCHQ